MAGMGFQTGHVASAIAAGQSHLDAPYASDTLRSDALLGCSVRAKVVRPNLLEQPGRSLRSKGQGVALIPPTHDAIPPGSATLAPPYGTCRLHCLIATEWSMSSRHQRRYRSTPLLPIVASARCRVFFSCPLSVSQLLPPGPVLTCPHFLPQHSSEVAAVRAPSIQVSERSHTCKWQQGNFLTTCSWLQELPAGRITYIHIDQEGGWHNTVVHDCDLWLADACHTLPEKVETGDKLAHLTCP